jgi:hypothetical protein
MGHGRWAQSCSEVVAFARRDIGAVAPLRWLRIPGLPRGTSGPFTRLLSDLTPAALGWGVGLRRAHFGGIFERSYGDTAADQIDSSAFGNSFSPTSHRLHELEAGASAVNSPPRSA